MEARFGNAAADLGHGGLVGGVTFSADGRRLITGGQDASTSSRGPLALASFAKPIHVWDTTTGTELASVPTSADTVRALVCRLTAGFSAGGQDDGSVTLWEFDTRRELAVLWAHEGAVHQLSFSKDGKVLATAGADGVVRVYDVAGQLGRTMPLGSMPAESLRLF